MKHWQVNAVVQACCALLELEVADGKLISENNLGCLVGMYDIWDEILSRYIGDYKKPW